MEKIRGIALAILWASSATHALAQPPTSDGSPGPTDAAEASTDDAGTTTADSGRSAASTDATTDEEAGTTTAGSSAPTDTTTDDEAAATSDPSALEETAAAAAGPSARANAETDDEAALAAELAAELGGDALGGDATDARAGGDVDTGAGGGGGGWSGQVQATGGAALGRVLMLPNISLIFTSGLFYFSDTPTIRPEGHDPIASDSGFRFQLQEVELALQAAIDPYVRADVFFALSLDGIELEEGYLTTTGLPLGLQLRAGQMYARFGRFNTQHFLETQPFADAPLVNRQLFSSEQLRGLGAELSWLMPLPWFAQLSAQMLTANNDQSFGVGVDETRRARDFLTVANLDQFFALSDTWSLKWGLSYAQGPNVTGGLERTADNRTQVFGTDLYLRWRDLSSQRYVALQSEFILRRADVEGGRATQGGLYAHLDARLSRNWQAAGRFDYFGLPSTLSGAPDLSTDEMAPFVPFTQWRAGVALSYYFSEFQRWRLQYNLDRLKTSREASVVPTTDPVHEVFLQYQFVMGSHGAHPF